MRSAAGAGAAPSLRAVPWVIAGLRGCEWGWDPSAGLLGRLLCQGTAGEN